MIIECNGLPERWTLSDLTVRAFCGGGVRPHSESEACRAARGLSRATPANPDGLEWRSCIVGGRGGQRGGNACRLAGRAVGRGSGMERAKWGPAWPRTKGRTRGREWG